MVQLPHAVFVASYDELDWAANRAISCASSAISTSISGRCLRLATSAWRLSRSLRTLSSLWDGGHLIRCAGSLTLREFVRTGAPGFLHQQRVTAQLQLCRGVIAASAPTEAQAEPPAPTGARALIPSKLSRGLMRPQTMRRSKKPVKLALALSNLAEQMATLIGIRSCVVPAQLRGTRFDAASATLPP